MNQQKKPLSGSEKEAVKDKIMRVLASHAGREKAIGMGELHEKIFNEPWHNRINDTRLLRRLITELRKEGEPICSASSRDGGGYYTPAVDQELEKYCERKKIKALKELEIISKIRAVSLPELLGQMALNMRGEEHGKY